MTPLIKQWSAIKAKYPDAIILFRVGDFYETFNEDAEAVARHLGVRLMTNSEKTDIKKGASLPHHCLDKALQVLVKAGHKVAICEELEAPKAGPMQSGVTDLLKPAPKPQQGDFNF